MVCWVDVCGEDDAFAVFACYAVPSLPSLLGCARSGAKEQEKKTTLLVSAPLAHRPLVRLHFLALSPSSSMPLLLLGRLDQAATKQKKYPLCEIALYYTVNIAYDSVALRSHKSTTITKITIAIDVSSRWKGPELVICCPLQSSKVSYASEVTGHIREREPRAGCGGLYGYVYRWMH